MTKRRLRKSMFSLSPVEFRTSSIAGTGVFAKRQFAPGDFIVAYAPKQRKVDASDPEAIAGADTKLTLSSEGRFVIIPDQSVPGGWLCNHSCNPNAAIFSDGEGRIECTRAIAPGDEVSIFYGWVTRNEPERDPCLCGSPGCRGFINFDLSDEDAKHVDIVAGRIVATDDALRKRLEEYGEFLDSIGQEQVRAVIANTLAAMKRADA